MAAGIVTIQANDAQGVARNIQFLSSDGTTNGLLSSLYQPTQTYPSPPVPLPDVILAGQTYNSGYVPGLGFGRAVVSFQSDQAGELTFKRYVDALGQVEIAAAEISVALVPNQLAVIVANDGVPFGSLSILATNPGGSNAAITNANLLLAP